MSKLILLSSVVGGGAMTAGTVAAVMLSEPDLDYVISKIDSPQDLLREYNLDQLSSQTLSSKDEEVLNKVIEMDDVYYFEATCDCGNEFIQETLVYTGEFEILYYTRIDNYDMINVYYSGVAAEQYLVDNWGYTTDMWSSFGYDSTTLTGTLEAIEWIRGVSGYTIVWEPRGY